MPGEWDLVKRSNGQITYTNNGQITYTSPNAGMNSAGQKVTVAVTGTKSRIMYQGGEGSPHTFKAMEIAELIARRR